MQMEYSIRICLAYILQKLKKKEKSQKKYIWQKKHLENQTGSKNSFKPIKIKKDNVQKKYEAWKAN